MIVVDTSFIYALIDRRDRRHIESVNWYQNLNEQICTSSLVIAEADYLINERLSNRAVNAFYKDISAGAFLIQGSQDLLISAISIAEKYNSIGLTDASLVVLAAKFATNVIATFDESHFRMIKPITKHSSFLLMPLDQ